MISACLKLIFFPPCCRTSFPTLTLHILALTEKCADGTQRILSLLSSCHHVHAKFWSLSLTAPSTSHSPTTHLYNTVHVQPGGNHHRHYTVFGHTAFYNVFSEVQYLSAGLKVFLNAVARVIFTTKTKICKIKKEKKTQKMGRTINILNSNNATLFMFLSTVVSVVLIFTL